MLLNTILQYARDLYLLKFPSYFCATSIYNYGHPCWCWPQHGLDCWTEQSCLNVINPTMAAQNISGRLITCFLSIRYCSNQGHVYCLVLPFESRCVISACENLWNGFKFYCCFMSSKRCSSPLEGSRNEGFNFPVLLLHLHNLLQHLSVQECLCLDTERLFFLFCLVSPICAYLKHSGMSKLSHIVIIFEILCKKMIFFLQISA